MDKIQKMPRYKCLRCGGKWIPRTENPKFCPKCNSPYWDKPKHLFPKGSK